MKKIMHAFFLLFLATICHAQVVAVTQVGDTVLLFEDGSWQNKQRISENPKLKEQIWILVRENSGTSEDAEQAYSMALQGWRYVLHRPKSPKAAWGHYDGRTTWWYGGWKNILSGHFSISTPILTASKIWSGDGQNQIGSWHNGGSPPFPSKIEIILSQIEERNE
jgi:hypothetical protein